jgi:uncharacterized membrane protein
LAGFTAATVVGWLRDGWPIASFATFGRRVHRLFLLLLLLLLLLLGWLLDFDMCKIRRCGLINELVQSLKSDASWCHRSNFVLQRVAETCPGNIVENFFMLQ